MLTFTSDQFRGERNGTQISQALFTLGAELRNGVARRQQVRGFFALWKDADPDIPILKEAKAEYATLK